MRELHNKINTAPHNLRYHVVLADVSIFERVLKVSVWFRLVNVIDYNIHIQLETVSVSVQGYVRSFQSWV